MFRSKNEQKYLVYGINISQEHKRGNDKPDFIFIKTTAHGL